MSAARRFLVSQLNSTAACFVAYCLALVIAFLPRPSYAASVSRVANGLLFKGPIVQGDAARLRAAFATHGNLPLFLDSPGGRVAEALQIARFLKERSANTHVPGDTVCASACVLIFAGGVLRTAHPRARFGVHMSSGLLNEDAVGAIQRVYEKHGPAGAAIVASEFEQMAALSTLRQANFYLEAGVSLRLLQLAAVTDHLDIRWLTYAEAREMNLVNAE